MWSLRDQGPSSSSFDAANTYESKVSSHAVVAHHAGSTGSTGGIVGYHLDGSLPETLLEQIDQTMVNLANIVIAAGESPRHITQLVMYATEWADDDPLKAYASFQKLLAAGDGKSYRPGMALMRVPALATPALKFEAIAAFAIPGPGHAWRKSDALRPYAPPRRKVDAVVIGAGFAGLQAALDLHKAGLSTLILEARHCIGGRSYSVPLKSGSGVIELGATWINPDTQPKITALIKKFGLQTSDVFKEGDIITELPDGSVVRGSDTAIKGQEVTKSGVEDLAKILEAVTSKLDIRDPLKWDGGPDVAFQEWMNSQKLDPSAQLRLTSLVSAACGCSTSEVSAHYLHDHVKSAGGLLSLATDGLKGAQGLKLRQGTRAIAEAIASELPAGSILLQTPAKSIEQYGKATVVSTANGEEFEAKKVVVAIPSNTYHRIRFNPPLPRSKAELVSQTTTGVYTKVVVSYSQPWWRELGLSGKMSSARGPILYSRDVSDVDSQQYSLASFLAGPNAAEWTKLDSLKRNRAVLDHLARFVGPEHEDKVYNVLEINSMTWSDEEYIETGPSTAIGPGLFSRYGDQLRTPVANIHFAGTETAFEWKGYLEGALNSGSRAADEIKALLPQ